MGRFNIEIWQIAVMIIWAIAFTAIFFAFGGFVGMNSWSTTEVPVNATTYIRTETATFVLFNDYQLYAIRLFWFGLLTPLMFWVWLATR